MGKYIPRYVTGVELLNDLIGETGVIEFKKIIELEHSVRTPVSTDLQFITDGPVGRDVDLLFEVKSRFRAEKVCASRCIGLLIAVRQVHRHITIDSEIDRRPPKDRWYHAGWYRNLDRVIIAENSRRCLDALTGIVLLVHRSAVAVL